MASVEEQRASNLVFFLQDRPEFVRNEFGTPEERLHLSEHYNSFAWIESFLWLHLGVQSNYFARWTARRLTYEYFGILLKAYEHILASKLDQRFSPPIQRILALEFGGRSELFSQREGIDNTPDAALPHFQSALILSNGFVSDLAIETLVDSIAFKSIRDWEIAIKELSDIGRLPKQNRKFLHLRETLPPTILSIVRYMETFHNLLSDFDKPIARSSGTQELAVTLLKERVKDIQRWRLDFRERPIFDRFIQALGLALTSLRTTEDEKNFVEDRKSFTRAVKSLMIDWGAPPLAMQAKA